MAEGIVTILGLVFNGETCQRRSSRDRHKMKPVWAFRSLPMVNGPIMPCPATEHRKSMDGVWEVTSLHSLMLLRFESGLWYSVPRTLCAGLKIKWVCISRRVEIVIKF